MTTLTNLFAETSQNFDPAKDKINVGSGKLPDGDYLMTVLEAYHNATPWGQEVFDLNLQVASGEFEKRREFIHIDLATVTGKGDPMPDFVIEKNMKMIMAVASVLGVPLTEATFAGELIQVYDNLEQAFSASKGRMMTVSIKETPNKKNPDYPYRNYEFSAPQTQTPVQPTLTDDDMPF